MARLWVCRGCQEETPTTEWIRHPDENGRLTYVSCPGCGKLHTPQPQEQTGACICIGPKSRFCELHKED